MTAREDLISSDFNGIDCGAIDQQILNSDAFKVWVIQKRVHESVVFLNEEHALCEYIYELAYGSPLRAFMSEPNNLGPPGLPAFENPLLALSCSPSLSLSESTVPTPTLSPPETPIERWQAIQEAPWRLSNRLEPLDHNQRPVLMEWLKVISPPNSRNPKWMCQVPSTVDIAQPCGATFPRWDRGLTHIRSKHLNLRPFPCGGGGDCKNPNCKMRFASKENLHQHQYLKRTTCQWCGKEELRQNLNRHYERCLSRPSPP